MLTGQVPLPPPGPPGPPGPSCPPGSSAEEPPPLVAASMKGGTWPRADVDADAEPIDTSAADGSSCLFLFFYGWIPGQTGAKGGERAAGGLWSGAEWRGGGAWTLFDPLLPAVILPPVRRTGVCVVCVCVCVAFSSHLFGTSLPVVYTLRFYARDVFKLEARGKTQELFTLF